MRPDMSVVVPAYNEASSIDDFFSAANDFLREVNFKIEFVFVDDGSTDDTYSRIQEHAIKNATCKIVKLSRNYGSHAAIRAGISQAEADRVMVYSMDMPEPISDIGLFYERLVLGSELVYSERVGYEGSLGSRIFGKLVNRYVEPSYPNEGLIGIAFGPKIKEQLLMNAEANSSIFFQVFQLGFTRECIPTNYIERGHGFSKWSFRAKLKHFIDCFTMFSYAPIRFISTAGMLLALLGIMWALAIILLRVTNAYSFAAGWPTTMAILLFGFGLTNVSLGIIAEYLVRDLDASRGRPVYVIDEVQLFGDS